MTTTSSLILLALGVVLIMIGLTVLGEVLRGRLAKGEVSPTLDTYQTRLNSWWAMVILLSLALLMGLPGVLVLFGIAAFAALREFLTYASKARGDHYALALAFYVILPAQFVFVGLHWDLLFSVFIPVYAFLLLPIVSALRGDAGRFLIRVAETQWGLMICVFCASHIPALMTLDVPGYAGKGALMIAFLVLTVQAGDLLDFWFGRRIGRTKIAPALSPRTWEGVALGTASAGLVGLMLFWITPFTPLVAMAMGAVLALTGMAGTLVLIAIKRDKGVRDWSHLIPGQGGILDQLAGVLFAAPVFYHLTRLVWLP
jgi:phosphatidate cytidylyltransferase